MSGETRGSLFGFGVAVRLARAEFGHIRLVSSNPGAIWTSSRSRFAVLSRVTIAPK